MAINDTTRGQGHTFETVKQSRAGRVFWTITSYPKTVLLLCLIVILGMGSFMPKLTRDTRSDAFISKDHPALIYRDKVKEVFGLADPVIVAIVNDGPEGVFNPKTLELVAWLTDEISNISGVDPDRITSLATESDIFGTEFGMEVEPFFEYPPELQEECDAIRTNVEDFPLYMGSLVAKDGSATLIVAELLDTESEAKNYHEFLALVDRAPIENGEVLHVAGEGAVSEFLGAYIDRDAKRLNPISAMVITLILLVTFRTLRGMIIPNLVVVGALAFTIGSMAAAGVPYFVITNSLPVIIIAISVADALHILSTYYEELSHHPEENSQQLAVRSMYHMWRPVTFTSLTDAAGFAGLSIASFMPPMRWYGIFACIGVFAALFFSMTIVPTMITLLKPKQSKPFRALSGQLGGSQGDAFSRVMAQLGGWVAVRPRAIVIVSVLITVAGIAGAVRLQANEHRMRVFKETESIRLADAAINERMNGTNNLDIVIETPEIEGLLNADRLRRIEALQAHVENQLHVQGSTSIVDYMKQMNRGVNEDRLDAYVLPDDDNLIAQYFLMYEVSGDPSDFEEEIDYDYRMANIRANMNKGSFKEGRPAILEMQRYIDEEFNSDDLTAHLAGGVYVDFNWIKDLARSHFMGVALALIGVCLMSSLSFRSFTAGLLATLPVCMALLAIYAVMGIFDIWLGVGTTMFAAIGIGVSVDFSIHTIDRMIALVKEEGYDIDEAFELLYPSTGRALLFSFFCMAIGFGVLLTSEVPPLNRFGLLVSIAVSISFLTSMTVLPALMKMLRPKFLGLNETSGEATETPLDPAV